MNNQTVDKFQKLNKKELDFFKSLTIRRDEAIRGAREVDLDRGPLSKIPSEEDRGVTQKKIEQVFASQNDYRKGSRFKLNKKVIETLSFLAMFRYATHIHLSKAFLEAPKTTLNRLYKMRNQGLIVSKDIYTDAAVWFLTDAGLIMSGFDVQRINDSKLTYSQFPQQFAINHIASNLWGGNLNVLALDDFPDENRIDMNGKKVQGENLISSLEVTTAFSRKRLFDKSAEYRARITDESKELFNRWWKSDKKTLSNSPEFMFGNEWMWAIIPKFSTDYLAYHIPDLIVRRDRSHGGKPNSIAVEVEVNRAEARSYTRILNAYNQDVLLYKKIVWVCKSITAAKKIEKIGRELGMIQSGKLKVLPIWTEHGVWNNKNPLSI